MQVKVVTRVLRTIDKLGGLDEYLVGSDTPARGKELGVTGWALRWRIMQTRGYRERVAAERRRLGLPERGWEVEEQERRKRERREAVRVAEAYLEAMKAKEQRFGRRVGSVEEAVKRASETMMKRLRAAAAKEQEDAQRRSEEDHAASAMKQEASEIVKERLEVSAAESDVPKEKIEDGLEASRDYEEAENPIETSDVASAAERNENTEESLEASTTEQEQTEKVFEPEFVVEEEQDESTEQDHNVAQQVNRVIESATPEAITLSPSEQLLAQLMTMATQIRSTPESLIKIARETIRNRTKQLAASTQQKNHLAAERASIVYDIEIALASPKRGHILTLHAEQLAIARSEAALQREREGKKPLTPEQIELNVLGPPSNVPADKWAEVRARVRQIKMEQPKRLRKRREQHARNVERRKYFQEHREEILVELKRKRRAVGLIRRAVYAVRNMRRGPGGLWGRIKGMVGMK